MICLFYESHYNPALSKATIYSTEQVAVIFFGEVVC